MSDLWNITNTFNTLNDRFCAYCLVIMVISYFPRLWQETTEEVLVEYQKEIILYIKEGYDERTVSRPHRVKQLINSNNSQVAERWSFPSALMFTLSVITMIGSESAVILTAPNNYSLGTATWSPAPSGARSSP